MNKKIIHCGAVFLTLNACSVAPDFKLPDLSVPDTYKEQKVQSDLAPITDAASWKEAKPLEEANRGQWWKIFEDAKLNELEQQAMASNPTLQAALARVEQARALVRANASTLLPTIDIGGNAVRSQPASAGTAAFGGNAGRQLKPYTLYSAGGSASYEVDLFARVRDNEKALNFEADSTEAMAQSMTLALQADVASIYFSLQAMDSEQALLRDTIGVRSEAKRIMQMRYDAGESSEQDLKRIQGDLASTEAELLALNRARANLEHALATLLGEMPSDFSMAETALVGMPPQIPADMPSSLLERRPDVVAAIRMMEAANKRIGVARTAFFPRIILTAVGGVESTTLGDLFQWSNRTWALGQVAGNAISMTLFDSGRNIARVDAADAAYNEAVAKYKADVLNAFREVENHLSEQRLLAEQEVQQDIAAEAASRATELAQLRYDEGETNYFEVTDSQRSSLAAERAALQIKGQRFITTVDLIRALGGEWDMREQPKIPSFAKE